MKTASQALLFGILLLGGCRISPPALPENNAANAELQEGTPPATPVLMKTLDPTALAKPTPQPAEKESGHEHHY